MKHLEHDNIIPFYGVSTTVADICLVSPWYENGNILDYLEKKPDANRFGLVSTFKQTQRSRRLPAATNRYRVRPTDSALRMKTTSAAVS